MKRKKFSVSLLFSMLMIGNIHAQHSMKMLNKFAGDWSAVVSMWTSPSDSPMVHTIKLHNDIIMNGLFLTSHYQGEMMGMEYEAMSTIGYNMLEGNYECTWIDNQNANIFFLRGKLSEDGNRIDFSGNFFDAAEKKEIMIRHIFSFTDEDHMKIEMFNGSGENEMKTYEFKLTRK